MSGLSACSIQHVFGSPARLRHCKQGLCHEGRPVLARALLFNSDTADPPAQHVLGQHLAMPWPWALSRAPFGPITTIRRVNRELQHAHLPDSVLASRGCARGSP